MAVFKPLVPEGVKETFKAYFFGKHEENQVRTCILAYENNPLEFWRHSETEESVNGLALLNSRNSRNPFLFPPENTGPIHLDARLREEIIRKCRSERNWTVLNQYTIPVRAHIFMFHESTIMGNGPEDIFGIYATLPGEKFNTSGLDIRKYDMIQGKGQETVEKLILQRYDVPEWLLQDIGGKNTNR